MKKYDARLEQWTTIGKCLWGTVYEDSKGRFADGTEVQTSTIVSHSINDVEEGIVIDTLHTSYLLGKRI